MAQQNLFKHSSLKTRFALIFSTLVAASLSAGTLAAQQPELNYSRPSTTTTRVAPTPQNTSFNGRVEHYLLNPRGAVDGLLLDNGLQVKFPPHLGDSVSRVVERGDRVRVTGVPGVASNNH